MSMFSGFTNQISGWVATKTGAGADPNADPNAQPPQMAPENGAEMMAGEECTAEGQAAGGVSGFAKGLMQKGFSIKDNLKEKAAVLNPHALQGIGSNLMGGITSMMPGRKEEEVPDPNLVGDMTGEMMVAEGEQQQWTE